MNDAAVAATAVAVPLFWLVLLFLMIKKVSPAKATRPTLTPTMTPTEAEEPWLEFVGDELPPFPPDVDDVGGRGRLSLIPTLSATVIGFGRAYIDPFSLPRTLVELSMFINKKEDAPIPSPIGTMYFVRAISVVKLVGGPVLTALLGSLIE